MVYMDNGATTAIKRDVVEAMIPFLIKYYGNPSGIYDLANVSRNAIEKARAEIAHLINAESKEILFTSGGTEGDNWIVKNVGLKENAHIIVSSIEHHAVLESCEYLKKHGTMVDYIKVNKTGVIDIDDLKSKIRANTKLISVMLVNNEIGTIQPIKRISEIARNNNILLHSDAVAAFGKVPIDVDELGVDYLTVSAHKFHGPKGCGFIYARNGNIESFINGGQQEYNLRAGTENVASIVGMAKAANIAVSEMNYANNRKIEIDKYICEKLKCSLDNVIINAENTRIKGIINMCFKGVDGGTLAYMLSKQGICVSTGSACMSFSKEPSHVLSAIGVESDLINSSIRLTIGEDITLKEANYVVECIINDVKKLKELQ